MAQVTMAGSVFLLWALACGGSDRSQSGGEVMERASCRKFVTMQREIKDGTLTVEEARTRAREVYEDARLSDVPGIRDAARDFAAGLTFGDMEAVEKAGTQMTSACGTVLKVGQ